MRFLFVTGLLRLALHVLLPLAVVLTTYLYLYPVFGGCGFPLPHDDRHSQQNSNSSSLPQDGAGPDATRAAFRETWWWHLPPGLASVIGNDRPQGLSATAPFRLLALGDPQLEGDSSIPNAHKDSAFPHLVRILDHAAFRIANLSLRERLRQILHDAVDFWFEDVPDTATSLRKRLDHIGNDYYLAHIYRTLHWWTVPTHVAVLGDLLGSQWISDAEFQERGRRYWERVFRGGERVPDDLALYPTDAHGPSGLLSPDPKRPSAWARRIINVAGNHDIGYAGDLTPALLTRFERLFGKANYELRFELPPDALSPEAAARLAEADSDAPLVPALRIVNLNDMNLDTPVRNARLQDETYAFINALIGTAAPVERDGHFTVVLTHVPLYKPAGVCVDEPYFSFHDDDDQLLREQNQLSVDASRGFLEGILGMHRDAGAPAGGRGRRGVILNGHDHEGCDTYHYVNQSAPADDEAAAAWQAVRWPAAQRDALVGRPGLPGVREITVRSMMGGYGGNAGLLSAWFDEDAWQWRFEFATCPLGREYVWWAVHVVDLIAVGVALAYGVALAVETAAASVKRGQKTAVRETKAAPAVPYATTPKVA